MHYLVGATIRATNRTHGLAPARPPGEPETVTQVLDEYDLMIRTDQDRIYTRNDFRVVQFAKRVMCTTCGMRGTDGVHHHGRYGHWPTLPEDA